MGLNHSNQPVKRTAAEQLLQRSVAMFEKIFGERHPSVARVLVDQARNFYDQGKYTEAVPLYQRAISIMETNGDQSGTQNVQRLLADTVARMPKDAYPYEVLENLHRQSFGLKPRPAKDYETVPLKKAIMLLQANGLGLELKDKVLKSLYEEFGYEDGSEELTADEFLGILQAYYADPDYGERRARAEGALIYELAYGSNTDDVVADLSNALGQSALFVDLEPANTASGDPEIVRLRRDDGNEVAITINCDCLDELVQLFNATLAERGDSRRFYSIDFDEYMYVCLTEEQQKALSKGKVLPFTALHGDEVSDR